MGETPRNQPDLSPYPPPPYPGGVGYGGSPYPTQPQGTSGLAIAAFVVGLVVPLLGVFIAIPLAVVALVRIGKTGAGGKGLAIAGIVLSVLWWVGAFAMAFVGMMHEVERNDAGEITEAGPIAPSEIRRGDCVNIPDPAQPGEFDPLDLKAVPCSEAHNAQALAVVPLRGDQFPGQRAIDRRTAQSCVNAYTALSDVSGNPDYDLYRIGPTKALWADEDARRVLCFVTKTDYGDMTGDLVR